MCNELVYALLCDLRSSLAPEVLRTGGPTNSAFHIFSTHLRISVADAQQCMHAWCRLVRLHGRSSIKSVRGKQVPPGTCKQTSFFILLTVGLRCVGVALSVCMRLCQLSTRTNPCASLPTVVDLVVETAVCAQFVKPVELSLRVRAHTVLIKLWVTVCVSPLTFPLSLCRCRSCCGWIDCPRECCCVPQRSLRLRNRRILRQRDRKRHTRSKTATVKQSAARSSLQIIANTCACRSARSDTLAYRVPSSLAHLRTCSAGTACSALTLWTQ
jgi:hypothetical protein